MNSITEFPMYFVMATQVYVAWVLFAALFLYRWTEFHL